MNCFLGKDIKLIIKVSREKIMHKLLQEIKEKYPWVEEHKILLDRLKSLLTSIIDIEGLEDANNGPDINTIRLKATIDTKIEVIYRSLMSLKPKEEKSPVPETKPNADDGVIMEI